MPKKPSKFWMFFQKIDRNTAECKLCGKHLRTCGNTTNLGKHIKRHPNYRELANHSADSEEESKPMKHEKLWTASGSANAGDLDDDDDEDDGDGGVGDAEYLEIAFDERAEQIVVATDPLLQEAADMKPDMKPSLKDLKKAMVKGADSIKTESLIPSNEPATKRIKSSPPSSSSSFPSNSLYNIEAAHLAFAEFFISCNIPFKVLNSIHFKRFLAKLNRSYRPPSLRELTTVYLDRAYDKYQVPITNDEKEAVLLLTGWKDFTSTEKCVVACLHLLGDSETRVFLNTWDLSIDVFPEHEDIQKKIVEESMKMARDNHNGKIYAVVSDSAVLNASSADLWHSCCQTYWANCLALDVVEAHDTRTLKLILQEFQSEEMEALIVERGGSRILLPWEGRWCTYRDSFQCYVKNNPFMRELIVDGKCMLEANVREAIFNDSFLAKIQTYVGILEPLCKLIYSTQKKKSTLAEVTEEWLQLVFPPEYEAYLLRRRNAALTPFALAANFVHPVYRGRGLRENQMEAVEFFFLENLDSRGLDDMFLFKKTEGIFQILAEKQVVTCSTFWSMASRKHPTLAGIARRLLAIPASVSYIDKIFASWSTTHLAARNLLGMDVYRKLTKTHFVLNIADSS